MNIIQNIKLFERNILLQKILIEKFINIIKSKNILIKQCNNIYSILCNYTLKSDLMDNLSDINK